MKWFVVIATVLSIMCSTANIVEADLTKPYILQIDIENAFSQEIQINDADTFNVATAVGDSRWSVQGSAQKGTSADTVTIDLVIKKTQQLPSGATISTKLHPKMNLKPDGSKADTIANTSEGETKHLTVTVSLRRSTP